MENPPSLTPRRMVRELREQFGTGSALAKKLRVVPSQITHWVRGSKPTPRMLGRIERLYARTFPVPAPPPEPAPNGQMP